MITVSAYNPTTSQVSWVGKKMCFSNIFENDYKIHDNIFYNCDNKNIIFEKYIAVGFGISLDSVKNVAFVVRLFSTNQLSAATTTTRKPAITSMVQVDPSIWGSVTTKKTTLGSPPQFLKFTTTTQTIKSNTVASTSADKFVNIEDKLMKLLQALQNKKSKTQ